VHSVKPINPRHNCSKPYPKLSYDHSAGSSLLLEPHVRLLFQNSKFCPLIIFNQNSKSKNVLLVENRSAVSGSSTISENMSINHLTITCKDKNKKKQQPPCVTSLDHFFLEMIAFRFNHFFNLKRKLPAIFSYLNHLHLL
jgi:hypothetical protein